MCIRDSSCYDIRALLDATSKMLDGKKAIDMKVPWIMKLDVYKRQGLIFPWYHSNSSAMPDALIQVL